MFTLYVIHALSTGTYNYKFYAYYWSLYKIQVLSTYKVNIVIWGGLVIRGPRYELHLTSFWKCLACADFMKDLIWRVQLLNANVFFSLRSLHLWLFICDYICDLFICAFIFQLWLGTLHWKHKRYQTWKMPYGINNNIFHKLQEKNTLAFSNWHILLK
jgi:hypothetical protein